MTNDKNTDKQMPELPEFIQLEILKLAKPKNLDPLISITGLKQSLKKLSLNILKRKIQLQLIMLRAKGFLGLTTTILK